METKSIRRVESRQSQEISRNTRLVPDDQAAALLSSIIDRSRMAKGWNRLAQSSAPGENSEQDVAIITWYEILVDAGVPETRWNDCYRAAQNRKNELLSQGKDPGIVTPNDLCVEWLKIKDLHSELDKTRLLPENAAGACQRCYGTGREEMPDGTVRDGCAHLPLSDDERRERVVMQAKRAEELQEEMRKIGRPKPVEVKREEKGQKLQCSDCGRKVNTLMGWQVGETCNQLLAEGPCEGEMKALS